MIEFITPRGVPLKVTAEDYIKLEAHYYPLNGSSHNTTAALNEHQQQTWDALDQLDPDRKGVHYTSLAQVLNIGHGAANQRAARVVKLGCAERIRAGVFVAIP
jgi:hypothetical protein